MLLSRKVVRGLVSTTVAAAVLAVPAVSSASTPVPPLQAGDTQAYASLTAGGPRSNQVLTRNFTDELTLNYTPIANRCYFTFATTINLNGTASVNQLTVPPGGYCSSPANPNCQATMSAPAGTPGLPWGARLVSDSAGTFRMRINVAKFTVTYSGFNCGTLPTGVPITMGGMVSPAVGNFGTRGTITFDQISGRLAFDSGSTGVHPYWSGAFPTAVNEPLFMRL